MIADLLRSQLDGLLLYRCMVQDMPSFLASLWQDAEFADPCRRAFSALAERAVEKPDIRSGR